MDIEKWQQLEDEKFLRTLVQMRLSKEMSVEDVMKLSPGMSALAISEIEEFTAVVSQSTIRRYAKAVGALVGHRVQAVPEDDQ